MRTKHIDGFINKYVVYEDGRVWSMVTNRFLKPYESCRYLKVKLEGKNYLVHRLVAQSFIPNREGKSDVNHIDGNKYNNHRSNLEWSTRSENLKHAHKLGLLNQSRKGTK